MAAADGRRPRHAADQETEKKPMGGKTGRPTHGSIIGGVCLAAICGAWTLAVGAADVDAAFKKFWDARNPQEAARAASDVVRSGVGFDDAHARLKRGRAYSSAVPRGIVRLSRRADGRQFFYDVNVPAAYDPTRRYQVRVQLHGGVMGRDTPQPRGDGSIGDLAGDADQIYVMPYAWRDAPWWCDAQVDNLRAILDSVKRSYNVDENRVALAGVSDGATATYYVAMRDTTSFASFLSLNGFLMVLGSPSIGAEGQLFPNNLLNKPYFVVNGGADPLYPTGMVEPYIERLIEGGVNLEYWPQPNAGHNTGWWPEMKEPFETFVREHPREPHPAALTWESVGDPRSNRAHWLVIDRLSPSREIAPRPDLSEIIQTEDQPASPRLLIHSVPFGRVDLVRRGNTVEASTRLVSAFTLLVSPEAFDLSRPIKVVADGRVVFDGRVERSVGTLMKWAARDNDRTMLFAAELHIRLQ